MRSRYTEGDYLDAHPTWHAEDAAWKASQIWRLLNDRHVLPTTVCEVGSGSGQVLRELSDVLPRSTRFTGYDISPQAVALSRKRAAPNVRFVEGDFLRTTESYDLLLLVDVLEHVENYFAFLEALRGRARRFVFHVPLDASAQALLRLKPLLKYRQESGHLHYFFKEQVVAVLRETGYRVMECRYTGSSVDLPAASVLSWFARLPRQLLFRLAPDFAVRALGGYSLLVFAEPTK